jgi:Zn-dependent alcohol dehydrogenase
MKTRAAVLRKAGTPWEVTELELDPPKANEVLIQMEAAGLCHSDEHIRSRGMARLPLVGGHEGAGVVVEAGPGVTRVKVGDRVSCSYIPVCGKCRYCSTGKQNLCDAGKWAGAKHVFAIDPNEWKQQQVLPGGILIGYHRKMQGSLFGGANPLYDIPMILSLWHEGHIKLSELITRTYTLDEINEGYQDLMDGKNIRGVVVHQH